MEQVYSLFEKQRMIRKAAQLVTPIISQLDSLDLPRNSFFHYTPTSKIDTGPQSDYPVFRRITKPIQVFTPTRLIEPVNGGRLVAFDPNPIIRGFFVRNRRYRRLTVLEKAPKDEKTLIVSNYSLIHHSYKYLRSLYADYNQWQDLMYTVTSTINEVANTTQRNQFIVIDTPRVLPSISRLKLASPAMDQTSVKIFTEDGSRMLLEFWRWMDEEKFANVFDRIESKNYRYVNFILRDGNTWTCINMDRLHNWKRSVADEKTANLKKGGVTEEGPRYENIAYANFQLQKYWLRLYMVLAARRSVVSLDADASIQQAASEVKQDKAKATGSTANVVESDDDAITENDDGSSSDESEVPVKKEVVLEESTPSSPNSKPNDGKASGDVLRALIKPANKDEDDSSIAVIDDEINAQIDADLASLETLMKSEGMSEDDETGQAAQVADNTPVSPLAIADKRTYDVRNKDRIATLAEAGLMTVAEYRRFNTLADKYKTLPNPFGGKGTLLEAAHIAPEELELDPTVDIAPNAVVLDETMKQTIVERAQRKYIKEILPRHILKCILHVQNADVLLDNIEIERTETVTGPKINYAIRTIPIEGAPGMLRFPIPEIQEDGVYIANGIRYSMRDQRGDLVVHKVSPSKVALTSYYGKFFVYRGRKAANDYSKWITDEVLTLANDPTVSNIYDVKTSNVFAMGIKAPRSISSLAHHIRQFTVKAVDGEDFTFQLDLTRSNEYFDQKVVGPWIKKGFTPIAISNKGKIIYYEGDSFYLIEGSNVKPLGELEEILGVSIASCPAEFVEVKIAGKYVPAGIVLAHDYGLTELIKRLKIQTRRVPVGTRTQQQDDEVAIVFSDETLLFNKNDRLACLLLGGFLEFKKIIRGFSITEFDRRGVYQNVLDSTGGGTRVLREIDLAKKLFVDPISLQVLEKLNQPTDFMGLLVYATELLLDDMHTHELDMSQMRIKGYERIAGAVYSELVRSLRAHNARPGKSRHPIEMKPFAIWQGLAQDASIVVVKDINPVENTKQREEVTFTGTGGRPKDTMTGHTRMMGESDKGIIGEASKDSGEVGINTYKPANPQISNLLGMPLPMDKRNLTPSALFSPSVLLAPSATRDDMKRQGFMSIQNSHSISTVAQQENILQTDYCNVLAHRVSELFAVTAKQKGVVKEKTEEGITVQYADGSTASYPLGRHYGENAGMTIPHTLVSDLKVGSKLIEGDAITYNKGFFRPSTMNPRQVTWCNGTYATFAFCEPSDVLEDASVICQKLADMLMTEQTKQRTIVVNFNQALARLQKVGTKVSYDDVLCIIQDEITSSMDLYDEADIDSLKALGSQAPKAKYDGVVERIEVFYRGDKEDMSESIRKIVNQADRELAQRRKQAGKVVVTGEVDEGFKVKGNSIPLDSVAIRIYITGPESAGVGDKIVLVAQLKSIIGKVLKEAMQAKDGTEVLGRFSYSSIARRIVNSPDIVGSTLRVLMRGAELAVEAYDS